jgi:hypothetical protein
VEETENGRRETGDRPDALYCARVQGGEGAGQGSARQDHVSEDMVSGVPGKALVLIFCDQVGQTSEHTGLFATRCLRDHGMWKMRKHYLGEDTGSLRRLKS